MNERELFVQALDIEDVDRRNSFLREACGDNLHLLRDVRALLDAHEKASGFLAHGLQDNAIDFPKSTEPTLGYRSESTAGSFVAGRYKLLQQIGEGGMGAVWMADQTEPVKRRVAVKLIRADKGTSKSILSRFAAERQAIALMDHPNIAKLLDAGTTEDGQPYFVMDLVKGIPVTEYCDAHRLSITDRLGLFVQICSAVQHAHQKGIIHRDIKPSNILVESHDGKPVPKIIDFGLAKATSGIQLSENTLFTGFGNVLGTPLYMAPEQAKFNAVDVDTRADVYALGVILYELLTGTTPLTRETVKKAAIDEMLKMIREQDAPTPSSRLSTSESKPSIAANRHTEPDKLGRFVKGELDWIVMKALSKERERRYETANGFAKDIERFLGDEPVQAGPPSVSYKFSKFVRRNRSQVVAASLLLFALVAGIIGTSWGLVEARRQQAIAILALDAERNAKREAEEKRAEAERQTTRAETGEKLASDRLEQVESEKQIAQAVKDFLQNKLLGQADPIKQAQMLDDIDESIDRIQVNPTITELLDRAATQLSPAMIDESFPNQSLLQAELLATVGETYRRIGNDRESLPLMDRAIAILESHGSSSAKELVRLMVSKSRNLLDQDQHEAAFATAEKAWILAKQALGEKNPDTIKALDALAHCHLIAGRVDESAKLYELALDACKTALPADQECSTEIMNNYAQVLCRQKHFKKAIELQEQVVRDRAKKGSNHPETLVCIMNLGCGYREDGRLAEAKKILSDSVHRAESLYGPLHPITIIAMGHLASSLMETGDKNEAIELWEKSVELAKKQYGEDNSFTLRTMNRLALAYLEVGRKDESVKMLESILRKRTEKYGSLHRSTVISIHNLAQAYGKVGRSDEAVELAKQALADASSQLGNEDNNTLKLKSLLAESLISQKKPAEALKHFQEVLDVRIRNLGTNHTDTIVSINNVGFCYRMLKQYDRAIELYEKGLRELDNSERQYSSLAFLLRINLAKSFVLAKRNPEAEQLALRIIQDGTEKVGPASDIVVSANALLGRMRFDEQRWHEAIPHLLIVYEQYKSTKVYDPAIDRLRTCYQNTGRLKEASEVALVVLQHLDSASESSQSVLTDLIGQLGEKLVLANEFSDSDALLTECLTARQRLKSSTADYMKGRIQAALGAAKMGLGQMDEAEQLLLQGQAEIARASLVSGLASFLQPKSKVQSEQIQQARLQVLEWLVSCYRKVNDPVKMQKMGIGASSARRITPGYSEHKMTPEELLHKSTMSFDDWRLPRCVWSRLTIH